MLVKRDNLRNYWFELNIYFCMLISIRQTFFLLISCTRSRECKLVFCKLSQTIKIVQKYLISTIDERRKITYIFKRNKNYLIYWYIQQNMLKHPLVFKLNTFSYNFLILYLIEYKRL